MGVGVKENVGMEGGGEVAGVGAKVTFLSKKLGCLAGDWAEGGVGAGVAAGRGLGLGG